MSTVASGWAWVEHLEAGGTTRWSEFRESGTTAAERRRPLPGVAQLELARRVNLAAPGQPHPVVPTILGAGAPGRGRQEFLLADAVPTASHGPRPVRPREVPAAELVRVAAGVLAEGLAAHPITAAGRPPARRRSRTLTLTVAPFDALLYDEWVARARQGRVRSWVGFIKHHAVIDRIPSAVDLAARADHWRRAWWHQIEVTAVSDTPATNPAAVAVVRHVNTLLGLLADEPRRAALVAEVVGPWLDHQPGHRLAVPDEHRDWVLSRAARMAEQMADAGYPVRGELAVLAQLDDTSARVTKPDDVLTVAVGLLRNGWEVR